MRVELINGPGIVPGARLRTLHGTEERRVAVRISLDREVGLTRHPDGRWVTIPSVDQVLVVVPAADDASMAEVLSFDPDTLIDAFNTALAAVGKNKAKLSHKAPIFIALDEPSRARHSEANAGLAAKAQWRELVSVPRHTSQTASRIGFVDRVRREFAEMMGVDVADVVVEFRLVSKGPAREEDK